MNTIPWYKRLYSTLLFWILLVSIAPISISSFISYSESIKNLEESSIRELKETSSLYVSFINSWFSYKEKDIIVQSKQDITQKSLASLVTSFSSSAKTLKDFTSSYKYNTLVTGLDKAYIELMLSYRYIEDIYLFDTSGNVLYSMNKSEDFATNFFNGKYSSSKHAQAYRETLKDNKVHFSDLEYYQADKGKLFGFLSAPVLNDAGEIQGVISYEIIMNEIDSLINNKTGVTNGLYHYIVGEDGSLRSRYKELDTNILDIFIGVNENLKLKDTYYLDRENEDKISYTTRLDVLGVKWTLQSEQSRIKLAEKTQDIAIKSIFIMLITFGVIFVLTFYMARKVTKPLVALSDASREIMNGNSIDDIVINEENELGSLSLAFNSMKNEQRKNALKIKEHELLAEEVIDELAEQKMALDLHAIVSITDIHGTISYVNSKFCEISGYSLTELVGKNHRMLNSGQHPAEMWENMYRIIAEGNVWHQIEVCNKSKSGELYWVDTTVIPFLDRDGTVKSYVSIRTDVTTSVLDRKKLTEAKEKAEIAVEAKAEFLASMSHEIRTPMNGIIGMLGLVKQTELNEEQNHKISVALSSAESLLSIINDILDFSKLEAEKIELEMVEFDLEEQLEHLIEACSVNLKSDDVKLYLDTTKLDTLKFEADIGRIKQVINNIVGNAVKFTHHGQIVLSVDYDLLVDDHIALSFDISDSGIGIPEDKIANLFEAFSQVDASTTRKYGGTGLGLSISKKLVNIMGGDISVRSEEGIGTIFSFYVNAKVAKESKVIEAEVSSIDTLTSHTNKNILRDKRILIVEDNLTNQMVVEGMIESIDEDIIIDMVNNGQEAVDRLAENSQQYALVFMDCQMPVLDGFGATRAIRESENKITIVAMTANAMQGDREKCITSGMDDYISKPLDSKKLEEMLLKWIK